MTLAGTPAIKHHKDIVMVQQVFDVDSPTIGTIQRHFGRPKAEAYLKIWFVHLNQALALKRPLTETQINMAAFEVAETYFTLKVADLAFLFRRITSGEFGEFYESLSVAKVLSFFRDYFDERCNAAVERSQSEHSDYMARQDHFNVSNNLRRTMDGSSQKFNHKKR